jgi:hypothetical protein
MSVPVASQTRSPFSASREISACAAWVICPGFVDTDMGYVVPGANPASFLTVEEVVDMARYLLHTGDNVKLGPQILLRTGNSA